jgi:hypothetical protein
MDFQWSLSNIQDFHEDQTPYRQYSTELLSLPEKLSFQMASALVDEFPTGLDHIDGKWTPWRKPNESQLKLKPEIFQ